MKVAKNEALLLALLVLLGGIGGCTEDECVYCGVDVSKGVRYGDDGVTLPKDKDIVSYYEEDVEAKEDVDIIDEKTNSENDGESPDEEILLPTENMITIEGASFMMGCEEGVSPNCTETKATPRHEVTVGTFEIDLYEVTKKEFEACIAAGACKNEGSITHYTSYGTEHPFCVIGNPEMPDDMPVNCVSWHGARAYCAWLEKRLPSEAEWEFAARGTDDRWYPWGKTPGPSCDTVVMAGDSDWGCDSGFAMPVGSKEAGKSPFGLYDMAGNVWEWVEDDWHENYDGAPIDGSAWVEVTRPANRVQRGGSFMGGSDQAFEFLAYGHYGAPADDTGVSYGFRCAR